MKTIIKNIILLSLTFFLSVCLSCHKYLDIKPDKSTSTIESLADLQLLMNYNVYAEGGALAVASTDEYYITNDFFSTRSKDDRNAYLWDANTDYILDWRSAYFLIGIYNTVLKELERVKNEGAGTKDNIKGQALMQRAFWFYQLAQIYAPPFSEENMNAPSIALRLTPDVEAPSVRATVRQTYKQIIDDLNLALEILPEKSSATNQPNKVSTLGMLSRVYLSMRDYINAEKCATEYLKYLSTLIDYNTLSITANPSISMNNIETPYYVRISGALTGRNSIIDPLLYKSYGDDDLRKKIFFVNNGNDTYRYKANYNGSSGHIPFCGITTSEMYLVRAECRARAGRATDALSDLNILLKHRWDKTKFTPYSGLNATEALELILIERKKELVWRGTRWTDLRRLNIEGRAINLKRIVNGKTYELPANDKRWTWLIPNEVITANNWVQNQR